jgi:hypothetical protein
MIIEKLAYNIVGGRVERGSGSSIVDPQNKP